MTIALNIHMYEAGAGGVPGGNYIGNIAGKVSSYEHSIVSTGGFESMSVTLTVPFYEALSWLQRGPMCSVEVTSPDAEPVWEGFLSAITATFGQESRSLSLDGMANRIRVAYSTTNGNAGTTTSISDINSQARFGVKDMVLSAAESDSMEAGYYAAVELVRRANPKMAPTTSVMTGDAGNVTLRLEFVGWYYALDWLVTGLSTTTKLSTTTQVSNLLTSYNSTNAFYSTSTLNIASSGITVTQFIAPQTTYREKIEALLGKGDGTYPLTWGVYEDREFYVQPWAGATPTVIAYQRFLGDAHVYNAGRAVVQPWNVRPNAMYQVAELLDVGPVAGAQDAASRFYVARTTCTISEGQIGCTLEPEDPQDLTAILITKY